VERDCLNPRTLQQSGRAFDVPGLDKPPIRNEERPPEAELCCELTETLEGPIAEDDPDRETQVERREGLSSHQRGTDASAETIIFRIIYLASPVLDTPNSPSL
jgi:hypothetical protein